MLAGEMTTLLCRGDDGRLPRRQRLLTRGRPLVLGIILLAAAGAARPEATTQGTPSADLLVRVGLTAEEAGKARAGQAMVRVLAPNVEAIP